MWFRFFLLILFTLMLGTLITVFLLAFISPEFGFGITNFDHFVLVPIQSIACFYQILDLLYSDSEAFKTNCRNIDLRLRRMSMWV